MERKPLISVIIPVYNCEKSIAPAIDSILDQTYRELEIIVVNDNSTDGTRAAVEKIVAANPRVKLIDCPPDPHRFDAKTGRNINAGYSARNAGFEEAKGELITFQDADDVSLLNRIEVQYDLLVRHDALHVTTDWVRFEERYAGKSLDLGRFLKTQDIVIGPREIAALASKTKGLVAKISPFLNSKVPFAVKRMRFLNRLFFGSLESYPGIPGIPLFRREVLDKVRFRKLSDRVWPSFMGRGADRDFSFQVAEDFGRSFVFLIPLYMWKVPNQNPRYEGGVEQFIIN